ncbi:enhancer of yellow 2 transcription factor homolog [Nannochloropsis oceanica]
MPANATATDVSTGNPNLPINEEQKQVEEQQRAAREQQIAILQQFVDSGGKDRLKAVLRERLQGAGWKEEVKELCKEVMRNNCIEGVTVDELVALTMPRARATIPDNLRVEALKAIRESLRTDVG